MVSYTKLSALTFLFLCVFMNNAKCQNTSSQKEWYTLLPACPCLSPDINGIQKNDGWAKDKGNIDKYHKGASESYRSYPPIKTKVGKSGQQCCYDSKGKLITHGSGAGTPDKISTCRGEDKNGIMKLRLWGIIGHIRKDVKPWENLMKKDPRGWIKYNTLWVPNNANNCHGNNIQL